MTKPNIHTMLKEDLIKYMTLYCRHGHTYAEHPNCWWIEQGKKPKVGYIDIETSNLDANYGIIITYCILDKDTNELIARKINPDDIRKGISDKNLCQLLIKDLLKFDVIKGYYSTRFDIPFMRSRCLKWKLPFPVYKTIQHKDIYYMVKRLLKLNRNSLDIATNFLGIKGKNHVSGDKWQEALFCDGEKQEKALQYILEHNIKDVKITKRLDKRLEQYDKGLTKSI